MGNRPAELEKALDTLLAQEGVDLDVVLVGNGWRPEGVPVGVRTVHLEENVGIPEGRNIGAREARGDILFFYDDDAFLPTTDVLARLAAEYALDERIAVVQPRGADPTGLPTPRRWVPHLKTAGGGAGGDVVVFWEGVCTIRRSAFEQVGGWPGHFWYGHEGIDLAYRLLDAGWRLRYRPDVVVNHPATQPTRHAVYYRMNARNRVWVAKRNLPHPVAELYVAVWSAITVARVRDREKLGVWFRGLREGVREDAGDRRPMGWATVARLSRAGRPPIV
ncbi:MAG: glycosyltransferase family 2 protein [Terrabacter sp.]|nr:glycosyltransferase family 2 protein [Dermatophilaceae bacterium]NUO92138.1 glycosyltransferase family 2 protein [Dermatophilaceae bacterium]NUQ33094.1 glycosyltransferase family 2 protein [Dermatophilaceae bacterium]NUR81559.1 glycosyltransferase family 2 protein [Dermatophilaceae bacterium]NUS41929.1 glycosyltransferase family 2 protein [Terrabacter sp.]